jgi:hypothetical protein
VLKSEQGTIEIIGISVLQRTFTLSSCGSWQLTIAST